MVKKKIKCKVDSKPLRIIKRGKSHFALTWAGLKYCIIFYILILYCIYIYIIIIYINTILYWTVILSL